MDDITSDYIEWQRANDGLSFEDWRACRDLTEQNAGGRQLLLENDEHDDDVTDEDAESDDDDLAEEFVEAYQREPILAMVRSICSDDHEAFESAFGEAMRRKSEVFCEHIKAVIAQKLYDDKGEE